jgi:outer membrane protein assembly factor BamB
LIAGADVIEAGTDGEVYRLDATTGEQVWSGEAARRRQKVVEPPPEIGGSYAQGR